MSDSWHEDQSDRRGRSAGPLAFGLVLIVLGLLLLAGQITSFDPVGTLGWPAWVIIPGLIMLVVGLAIPHEGGLGAAIPGAIVTTTGILLAYQEATNSFATWAYAWALVAPGSVGVALLLFGILHAKFDLVDAGLRTAAVGLGLFVGFGIFFENILNFDKSHPHEALRAALPVMAIAMGAIIVVLNLIPQRHTDWQTAGEDADTDEPPKS